MVNIHIEDPDYQWVYDAVLYTVGEQLPKADIAAVRAMATDLINTVTMVNQQTGHTATLARNVPQHLTGDAADAFDTYAATITRDLPAVSEIAASLAGAADGFALDTEAAQYVVLIVAFWTVLEIFKAMLTGFGAAAAPAIIAAGRKAIKETLDELRTSLTKRLHTVNDNIAKSLFGVTVTRGLPQAGEKAARKKFADMTTGEKARHLAKGATVQAIDEFLEEAGQEGAAQTIQIVENKRGGLDITKIAVSGAFGAATSGFITAYTHAGRTTLKITVGDKTATYIASTKNMKDIKKVLIANILPAIAETLAEGTINTIAGGGSFHPGATLSSSYLIGVATTAPLTLIPTPEKTPNNNNTEPGSGPNNNTNTGTRADAEPGAEPGADAATGTEGQPTTGGTSTTGDRGTTGSTPTDGAPQPTGTTTNTNPATVIDAPAMATPTTNHGSGDSTSTPNSATATGTAPATSNTANPATDDFPATSAAPATINNPSANPTTTANPPIGIGSTGGTSTTSGYPTGGTDAPGSSPTTSGNAAADGSAANGPGPSTTGDSVTAGTSATSDNNSEGSGSTTTTASPANTPAGGTASPADAPSSPNQPPGLSGLDVATSTPLPATAATSSAAAIAASAPPSATTTGSSHPATTNTSAKQPADLTQPNTTPAQTGLAGLDSVLVPAPTAETINTATNTPVTPLTTPEPVAHEDQPAQHGQADSTQQPARLQADPSTEPMPPAAENHRGNDRLAPGPGRAFTGDIAADFQHELTRAAQAMDKLPDRVESTPAAQRTPFERRIHEAQKILAEQRVLVGPHTQPNNRFDGSDIGWTMIAIVAAHLADAPNDIPGATALAADLTNRYEVERDRRPALLGGGTKEDFGPRERGKSSSTRHGASRRNPELNTSGHKQAAHPALAAPRPLPTPANQAASTSATTPLDNSSHPQPAHPAPPAPRPLPTPAQPVVVAPLQPRRRAAQARSASTPENAAKEADTAVSGANDSATAGSNSSAARVLPPRAATDGSVAGSDRPGPTGARPRDTGRRRPQLPPFPAMTAELERSSRRDFLRRQAAEHLGKPPADWPARQLYIEDRDTVAYAIMTGYSDDQLDHLLAERQGQAWVRQVLQDQEVERFFENYLPGDSDSSARFSNVMDPGVSREVRSIFDPGSQKYAGRGPEHRLTALVAALKKQQAVLTSGNLQSAPSAAMTGDSLVDPKNVFSTYLDGVVTFLEDGGRRRGAQRHLDPLHKSSAVQELHERLGRDSMVVPDWLADKDAARSLIEKAHSDLTWLESAVDGPEVGERNRAQLRSHLAGLSEQLTNARIVVPEQIKLRDPGSEIPRGIDPSTLPAESAHRTGQLARDRRLRARQTYLDQLHRSVQSVLDLIPPGSVEAAFSRSQNVAENSIPDQSRPQDTHVAAMPPAQPGLSGARLRRVPADGYCQLYSAIGSNPSLVHQKLAVGTWADSEVLNWLQDTARVRADLENSAARGSEGNRPADDLPLRAAEALHRYIINTIERYRNNSTALPEEIVKIYRHNFGIDLAMGDRIQPLIEKVREIGLDVTPNGRDNDQDWHDELRSMVFDYYTNKAGGVDEAEFEEISDGVKNWKERYHTSIGETFLPILSFALEVPISIEREFNVTSFSFGLQFEDLSVGRDSFGNLPDEPANALRLHQFQEHYQYWSFSDEIDNEAARLAPAPQPLPRTIYDSALTDEPDGSPHQPLRTEYTPDGVIAVPDSLKVSRPKVYEHRSPSKNSPLATSGENVSMRRLPAPPGNGNIGQEQQPSLPRPPRQNAAPSINRPRRPLPLRPANQPISPETDRSAPRSTSLPLRSPATTRSSQPPRANSDHHTTPPAPFGGLRGVRPKLPPLPSALGAAVAKLEAWDQRSPDCVARVGRAMSAAKVQQLAAVDDREPTPADVAGRIGGVFGPSGLSAFDALERGQATPVWLDGSQDPQHLVLVQRRSDNSLELLDTQADPAHRQVTFTTTGELPEPARRLARNLRVPMLGGKLRQFDVNSGQPSSSVQPIARTDLSAALVDPAGSRTAGMMRRFGLPRTRTEASPAPSDARGSQRDPAGIQASDPAVIPWEEDVRDADAAAILSARLAPLKDLSAVGTDDEATIDLVLMASPAKDRVWLAVRLPGRPEPVNLGSSHLDKPILQESSTVLAVTSVNAQGLARAVAFSEKNDENDNIPEVWARSLRDGDAEFARRFLRAAGGAPITDINKKATVPEFVDAMRAHSNRTWSHGARPDTTLEGEHQLALEPAELALADRAAAERDSALVWARHQIAVDHQRPEIIGPPTTAQSNQLRFLEDLTTLVAAESLEQSRKAARVLSQNLGRSHGTLRDFTPYAAPEELERIDAQDWEKTYDKITEPLRRVVDQARSGRLQHVDLVLLAAPLRAVSGDFSPGHAVVAFRLPGGEQVALGFYPHRGLFGAQGAIKDDNTYVTAPKTRVLKQYNISGQQLARAVEYIEGRKGSDYHLLQQNCVVFATQLVSAAVGGNVVGENVTTPNELITTLYEKGDWADDETGGRLELTGPARQRLAEANHHLDLVGRRTRTHDEVRSWAAFQIAMDHQRPLIVGKATARQTAQRDLLEAFTTIVAAEYDVNGPRAAAALSRQLGSTHGTLRPVDTSSQPPQLSVDESAADPTAENAIGTVKVVPFGTVFDAGDAFETTASSTATPVVSVAGSGDSTRSPADRAREAWGESPGQIAPSQLDDTSLRGVVQQVVGAVRGDDPADRQSSDGLPMTDCVALANTYVSLVHPRRRPLESADDVAVDRGGVVGVRSRLVAGRGWALVDDHEALHRLVDDLGPGATVVLLDSRQDGRVGHVRAWQNTRDGVRGVDPQNSRNPVYPVTAPDRRAGTVQTWALVIDGHSRVVDPTTRSENYLWTASPSASTTAALLDAPVNYQFGGLAEEIEDHRVALLGPDNVDLPAKTVLVTSQDGLVKLVTDKKQIFVGANSKFYDTREARHADGTSPHPTIESMYLSVPEVVTQPGQVLQGEDDLEAVDTIQKTRNDFLRRLSQATPVRGLEDSNRTPLTDLFPPTEFDIAPGQNGVTAVSFPSFHQQAHLYVQFTEDVPLAGLHAFLEEVARHARPLEPANKFLQGSLEFGQEVGSLFVQRKTGELRPASGDMSALSASESVSSLVGLMTLTYIVTAGAAFYQAQPHGTIKSKMMAVPRHSLRTLRESLDADVKNFLRREWQNVWRMYRDRFLGQTPNFAADYNHVTDYPADAPVELFDVSVLNDDEEVIGTVGQLLLEAVNPRPDQPAIRPEAFHIGEANHGDGLNRREDSGGPLPPTAAIEVRYFGRPKVLNPPLQINYSDEKMLEDNAAALVAAARSADGVAITAHRLALEPAGRAVTTELMIAISRRVSGLPVPAGKLRTAIATYLADRPEMYPYLEVALQPAETLLGQPVLPPPVAASTEQGGLGAWRESADDDVSGLQWWQPSDSQLLDPVDEFRRRYPRLPDVNDSNRDSTSTFANCLYSAIALHESWSGTDDWPAADPDERTPWIYAVNYANSTAGPDDNARTLTRVDDYQVVADAYTTRHSHGTPEAHGFLVVKLDRRPAHVFNIVATPDGPVVIDSTTGQPASLPRRPQAVYHLPVGSGIVEVAGVPVDAEALDVEDSSVRPESMNRKRPPAGDRSRSSAPELDDQNDLIAGKFDAVPLPPVSSGSGSGAKAGRPRLDRERLRQRRIDRAVAYAKTTQRRNNAVPAAPAVTARLDVRRSRRRPSWPEWLRWSRIRLIVLPRPVAAPRPSVRVVDLVARPQHRRRWVSRLLGQAKAARVDTRVSRKTTRVDISVTTETTVDRGELPSTVSHGDFAQLVARASEGSHRLDPQDGKDQHRAEKDFATVVLSDVRQGIYYHSVSATDSATDPYDDQGLEWPTQSLWDIESQLLSAGAGATAFVRREALGFEPHAYLLYVGADSQISYYDLHDGGRGDIRADAGRELTDGLKVQVINKGGRILTPPAQEHGQPTTTSTGPLQWTGSWGPVLPPQTHMAAELRAMEVDDPARHRALLQGAAGRDPRTPEDATAIAYALHRYGDTAATDVAAWFNNGALPASDGPVRIPHDAYQHLYSIIGAGPEHLLPYIEKTPEELQALRQIANPPAVRPGEPEKSEERRRSQQREAEAAQKELREYAALNEWLADPARVRADLDYYATTRVRDGRGLLPADTFPRKVAIALHEKALAYLDSHPDPSTLPPEILAPYRAHPSLTGNTPSDDEDARRAPVTAEEFDLLKTATANWHNDQTGTIREAFLPLLAAALNLSIRVRPTDRNTSAGSGYAEPESFGGPGNPRVEVARHADNLVLLPTRSPATLSETDRPTEAIRTVPAISTPSPDHGLSTPSQELPGPAPVRGPAQLDDQTLSTVVGQVVATVRGGGAVGERSLRELPMTDCVELAGAYIRLVHPDIRPLVPLDDLALARGGVAGLQNSLVSGPGWAVVDDHNALHRLVEGLGPGATVVLLESRGNGHMGHVRAWQNTSQGLRGVDPQSRNPIYAIEPADPMSDRPGGPDGRFGVTETRAMVIDGQSRVVAPHGQPAGRTWAASTTTSTTTSAALVDPSAHEFGGSAEELELHNVHLVLNQMRLPAKTVLLESNDRTIKIVTDNKRIWLDTDNLPYESPEARVAANAAPHPTYDSINISIPEIVSSPGQALSGEFLPAVSQIQMWRDDAVRRLTNPTAGANGQTLDEAFPSNYYSIRPGYEKVVFFKYPKLHIDAPFYIQVTEDVALGGLFGFLETVAVDVRPITPVDGLIRAAVRFGQDVGALYVEQLGLPRPEAWMISALSPIKNVNSLAGVMAITFVTTAGAAEWQVERRGALKSRMAVVSRQPLRTLRNALAADVHGFLSNNATTIRQLFVNRFHEEHPHYLDVYRQSQSLWNAQIDFFSITLTNESGTVIGTVRQLLDEVLAPSHQDPPILPHKFDIGPAASGDSLGQRVYNNTALPPTVAVEVRYFGQPKITYPEVMRNFSDHDMVSRDRNALISAAQTADQTAMAADLIDSAGHYGSAVQNDLVSALTASDQERPARIRQLQTSLSTLLRFYPYHYVQVKTAFSPAEVMLGQNLFAFFPPPQTGPAGWAQHRPLGSGREPAPGDISGLTWWRPAATGTDKAEALHDQHPWLADVNESGPLAGNHFVNCLYTAIALHQSWTGDRVWQAPRTETTAPFAFALNYANTSSGQPHELILVADYQSLVDAYIPRSDGEPDAHGFLIIEEGTLAAHVVNIIATREGPLVLDGQTGQPAALPADPQAIYHLPVGPTPITVPGTRIDTSTWDTEFASRQSSTQTSKSTSELTADDNSEDTSNRSDRRRRYPTDRTATHADATILTEGLPRIGTRPGGTRDTSDNDGSAPPAGSSAVLGTRAGDRSRENRETPPNREPDALLTEEPQPDPERVRPGRRRVRVPGDGYCQLYSVVGANPSHVRRLLVQNNVGSPELHTWLQDPDRVRRDLDDFAVSDLARDTDHLLPVFTLPRQAAEAVRILALRYLDAHRQNPAGLPHHIAYQLRMHTLAGDTTRPDLVTQLELMGVSEVHDSDGNPHSLFDAPSDVLRATLSALSSTPTAPGEMSLIHDAVEDWHRNWSANVGETFIPVLAAALGLRITLLSHGQETPHHFGTETDPEIEIVRDSDHFEITVAEPAELDEDARRRGTAGGARPQPVRDATLPSRSNSQGVRPSLPRLVVPPASVRSRSTLPAVSGNAAVLLADLSQRAASRPHTSAPTDDLLGPDLFGMLSAAPRPAFMAPDLTYDRMATNQFDEFFAWLNMTDPEFATGWTEKPLTVATLAEEANDYSTWSCQLEEERSWTNSQDVAEELRVLPQTLEVPLILHAIWLGTPLGGTEATDDFRRNLATMAKAVEEAGFTTNLYTDITRAEFIRARSMAGRDDLVPDQAARFEALRDMMDWARAHGIRLVNVHEVFHEDINEPAFRFALSELAKQNGRGYAAASDIIRVLLMVHIGGWYTDGDNPFRSTPMTHDFGLGEGLEETASWVVELYNHFAKGAGPGGAPSGYGVHRAPGGQGWGNSSFFGARNHPFFRLYLDQIQQNYAKTQRELIRLANDTDRRTASQLVTFQMLASRRHSVMTRTGPDVLHTLRRQLGIKAFPALTHPGMGTANSWMSPDPFQARRSYAPHEISEVLARAATSLVRGLHNREGDLHLTSIAPIINGLPEPDAAWEALVEFLLRTPGLPAIRTVTDRTLVNSDEGAVVVVLPLPAVVRRRLGLEPLDPGAEPDQGWRLAEFPRPAQVAARPSGLTPLSTITSTMTPSHFESPPSAAIQSRPSRLSLRPPHSARTPRSARRSAAAQSPRSRHFVWPPGAPASGSSSSHRSPALPEVYSEGRFILELLNVLNHQANSTSPGLTDYARDVYDSAIWWQPESSKWPLHTLLTTLSRIETNQENASPGARTLLSWQAATDILIGAHAADSGVGRASNPDSRRSVETATRTLSELDQDLLALSARPEFENDARIAREYVAAMLRRLENRTAQPDARAAPIPEQSADQVAVEFVPIEPLRIEFAERSHELDDSDATEIRTFVQNLREIASVRPIEIQVEVGGNRIRGFLDRARVAGQARSSAVVHHLEAARDELVTSGVPADRITWRVRNRGRGPSTVPGTVVSSDGDRRAAFLWLQPPHGTGSPIDHDQGDALPTPAATRGGLMGSLRLRYTSSGRFNLISRHRSRPAPQPPRSDGRAAGSAQVTVVDVNPAAVGLSWLSGVNKWRDEGGEFTTNCVLAAMGTDMSLQSRGEIHHQVPPSEPLTLIDLINYANDPERGVPRPADGFRPVHTTTDAVRQALAESEPGERGVVIIPDGSGHVVNAVRLEDGPALLDGQIGRIVDLPGDLPVYFLPFTSGVTITGAPVSESLLTDQRAGTAGLGSETQVVVGQVPTAVGEMRHLEPPAAIGRGVSRTESTDAPVTTVIEPDPIRSERGTALRAKYADDGRLVVTPRRIRGTVAFDGRRPDDEGRVPVRAREADDSALTRPRLEAEVRTVVESSAGDDLNACVNRLNVLSRRLFPAIRATESHDDLTIGTRHPHNPFGATTTWTLTDSWQSLLPTMRTLPPGSTAFLLLRPGDRADARTGEARIGHAVALYNLAPSTPGQAPTTVLVDLNPARPGSHISEVDDHADPLGGSPFARPAVETRALILDDTGTVRDVVPSLTPSTSQAQALLDQPTSRGYGAEGVEPDSPDAAVTRKVDQLIEQIDRDRLGRNPGRKSRTEELSGPDPFNLRRLPPAPPNGIEFRNVPTGAWPGVLRGLDLRRPATPRTDLVDATATESWTVAREGSRWAKREPEVPSDDTVLPHRDMPQLVHTIWFGGSPPDYFIRNIRDMVGSLGGKMTVVLWTDLTRDNIHQVPALSRREIGGAFSVVNVFDVFHDGHRMDNFDAFLLEWAKGVPAGYAAASDILRYELMEIGGIYTDGDNTFHTERGLDTKLAHHGFAVHAHVEIASTDEETIINNSALASTRGNPAFAVIRQIVAEKYTMRQAELNPEFHFVADDRQSQAAVYTLPTGKIRTGSVVERTGPDLLEEFAQRSGYGNRHGLPNFNQANIRMGAVNSWRVDASAPKRTLSEAEELMLVRRAVTYLARDLINRDGDLNLFAVRPMIDRMADPAAGWTIVAKVFSRWPEMWERITTVTFQRLEGDYPDDADSDQSSDSDDLYVVRRQPYEGDLVAIALPRPVLDLLGLPIDTESTRLGRWRRGAFSSYVDRAIDRKVQGSSGARPRVRDNPLHIAFGKRQTGLTRQQEDQISAAALGIVQDALRVHAQGRPRVEVSIEGGGNRPGSNAGQQRVDAVTRYLNQAMTGALKKSGPEIWGVLISLGTFLDGTNLPVLADLVKIRKVDRGTATESDSPSMIEVRLTNDQRRLVIVWLD
ncbi:hypothetical protein [Paractinoplanes brasiliensis]|uniref:Autotransporter adhesin n=1 Tax=Paractinoplanes brasiliensis TaxID=52695 RepID=A0A4R6JLB5_9ACTN|nr:hypothetical protein [Actinoplanes brasiliensis]TDO37094.1 autotransporter adhesin [Actinoplanes brasiliensis]GID32212.1 hypothetical protein Abr02nite_71950 [Actinoplanes brasiliensis]